MIFHGANILIVFPIPAKLSGEYMSSLDKRDRNHDQYPKT